MLVIGNLYSHQQNCWMTGISQQRPMYYCLSNLGLRNHALQQGNEKCPTSLLLESLSKKIIESIKMFVEDELLQGPLKEQANRILRQFVSLIYTLGHHDHLCYWCYQQANFFQFFEGQIRYIKGAIERKQLARRQFRCVTNKLKWQMAVHVQLLYCKEMCLEASTEHADLFVRDSFGFDYEFD